MSGTLAFNYKLGKSSTSGSAQRSYPQTFNSKKHYCQQVEKKNTKEFSRAFSEVFSFELKAVISVKSLTLFQRSCMLNRRELHEKIDTWPVVIHTEL